MHTSGKGGGGSTTTRFSAVSSHAIIIIWPWTYGHTAKRACATTTVRFARRLCATPHHARRFVSNAYAGVCAHAVSTELWLWSCQPCGLCYIIYSSMFWTCAKLLYSGNSTCTSQMPHNQSQSIYFSGEVYPHTPLVGGMFAKHTLHINTKLRGFSPKLKSHLWPLVTEYYNIILCIWQVFIIHVQY